MNFILLFLIPSLLAIIILPMIADRCIAAKMSFLFSVFSFLCALPLIFSVYFHDQTVFFLNQWLFCDKLGAFFIGINSFILMSTSFYSLGYLANEPPENLSKIIYRYYHTFFHLFSFGMLIVILSNNIGLMWIAMELSTIASVVLVALYQTQEALEAAWKYLILCGMGIGLALLGTVIIYFAAHDQLTNEQGLLWTALFANAPNFSAKLLAISFVFLFIGYGTKAGFFPLHNWLPDAHSEGPAPISALLSGLLLNVALLAIFRFKLILSKTSDADFASHLLLWFGFASLLFASFSLMRQRKLKRLFAYSSIEHIGLISIALGIGTPLAYFAGLLHLLMHSLSKTAAFFSSGSIIQRFHTQTISQLKGLTQSFPFAGWSLLFCCFALLGLPPSGIFFSELLLLLAILKTHALLALPLIIGLVVSFIAIFYKIQPIAFSMYPLTNDHLLKNREALTLPIMIHLFLVLLAGMIIPLLMMHPIAHVLW